MQRNIGRTSAEVYPVGWGVMPLSTTGRPDEATAMDVFRAALDNGVTFWDTANAYCMDDNDTGHNERLIAKAFRELGVAGEVRVATKGGMTRPGGAWVTNGRPEALQAACEQSLRDLGVEQIFLYQLHWPDPDVPYAESVGALARLREQGKIAHVGVSNVDAAKLRQALGIVRVESVQNRCNLHTQGDFTNGVLELCRSEGLTYIPYSPVGGRSGKEATGRDKLLAEIGGRHGCSPYQAVLAWLLGKDPCVVPIPGASKVANLADSAGAAHLKLDAEDIAKMDAFK